MDNILGRNSFHEIVSELTPERSEEFDFGDDVMSDDFSQLGSSPSMDGRARDDDIIGPVANFSLSNNLRLTSLIVPQQHSPPPRHFPPSPSGPNLSRSQPFLPLPSPQIPPPPIVRDLRSSGRMLNESLAKTDPWSSYARSNDTNSRMSDSYARTSDANSRLSDSYARSSDTQSRGRTDSLSPTSEYPPSLSVSAEFPVRSRSNSLSPTGEVASRSRSSSLSRELDLPGPADAVARAEQKQKPPHLVLSINIPPPSLPFVPKSPLCKDSLRVPLPESGEIKNTNPPEVV